jgi:hypothetical protein
MKVRKKLVVVDAVQFTLENARNGTLPDGTRLYYWNEHAATHHGQKRGELAHALIETSSGQMRVDFGEWITVDSQGVMEWYDQSTFEELFEKVEEPNAL